MKISKNTIALVLAAAASIISLYGVSNSETTGTMFLGLAAILSLVSYVLGGGLGDALRAAATVGKWGWIVAPFPFDLLTGLISIGIACLLFLLFPIVFVGKSILGKD